MSPVLTRRTVVGVLALAVVALGVVGAVRAVGGGAVVGSFSWFRATGVPPGWHELAAADGAALAYPPSLTPAAADPGAVTVEQRARNGSYVAYLNATPWDGPAPLHGWAAARLDRLADENRSVQEDGAAEDLAFADGGRGSCVADHYVTRVGHHPFVEMACLVRARTGAAAVVVAAASSAHWPAEAALLRRALDAFRS